MHIPVKLFLTIFYIVLCHYSLWSQNAANLKIAQTTKPIDDAVLAPGLEQAQGSRHQHAVDVRVDLREVGGLVRHGDAELRQSVAQNRAALVQQANRIGAFGLGPPLHPVQLSKVAQTLKVSRAQGLHVAQDQSGDIIAAGQLDLRAGLAGVHVENHLA